MLNSGCWLYSWMYECTWPLKTMHWCPLWYLKPWVWSLLWGLLHSTSWTPPRSLCSFNFLSFHCLLASHLSPLASCFSILHPQELQGQPPCSSRAMLDKASLRGLQPPWTPPRNLSQEYPLCISGLLNPPGIWPTGPSKCGILYF